MENKTKESISRILLIVFWVMIIISFFSMAIAGTMVFFYACLGFLLIPILLIGVDKHRKYVCIGLAVILLLIMSDHIAGRKLHQHRLQSYYDQIKKLETKLSEYENTTGGNQ